MNARQAAIRAALMETAGQPFSYGTLDCCLWVSAIAERITGTNYAARFLDIKTVPPGAYTAREAMDYIAANGGLENLVTVLLGAPVDDLENLQDGDPVLVRIPTVTDSILAIYCNGQVIAKQFRGVIRLPADIITKGWNI